ncbi:hypothetical protein ABMA28_008927 [Loxostege sticticalis]
MYKEEELKRLHAAGYGQVGFNYDATQQEPEQPTPPAEVDEPFLPTPAFKALLPPDMLLPESQKQNAIIEKTAKFIASQGAQMEILIKAKQGDNPQFQFLNKDNSLNPYYAALIGLVKAGKWPEKQAEVVEERPPENEEYLHPSLASTIIESAPSIPSIHYKPSADCDYTMLISKMRGEATLDEAYAPELAPGEVAPPGTEPLPPRAAEIQRAPVMYNAPQPHPPHTQAVPPVHYQQYAAYYQQQQPIQPPPAPPTAPPVTKSTGLSLMNHYNTDSDTDDSDSDESSSSDSKTPIATPPEDVQIVIDKMAAYVARNGDEFAEIVRAKNDPRFTFLEPNNVYHAYYKRLMQQKRGVDVNGKAKETKKKTTAPVSFSIKKLKEPDPILPKPALPYESSSDEETEKGDKAEEPKETPKPPNPQTIPVSNIPPVVVYKIENQIETVKPVEPVKPVPVVLPEVKEVPKIVEKEEKPIQRQEDIKTKSPTPDDKKYEKRDKEYQEKREKDSPRREKRKHRDRKKEYRSKSESRESKRVERSVDKEKRKDRDGEREKKRRRYSREELDSEIISLVDTTDDLIDLTGDHDSKGEVDPEADKAKQQERRRRAAEFLKKVGVDPAAAALPTSSLASAMVDTLESLRKKKAEEEEKRRKREKRRHRDRYDYENGSERSSHRKSKRRKNRSSEENDESDYDGAKKKKRKKEKRHASKSKKKRRREVDIEEEEVIDHPISIDLTSTLKELRTASPTKDLVQDIDDTTQHSLVRQGDSSDEGESREGRRERKRKKEDREYSEGEWSSDSEQDSGSSSGKDE